MCRIKLFCDNLFLKFWLIEIYLNSRALHISLTTIYDLMWINLLFLTSTKYSNKFNKSQSLIQKYRCLPWVLNKKSSSEFWIRVMECTRVMRIACKCTWSYRPF